MPKVSVDLIHEVLTNENLEPDQVNAILHRIEKQAAEEAEAEKAGKEPPVKKQLCAIISDPNGILPDQDFVGWVARIPEDEAVSSVMDRLIRATYEYNISKKGRKYPCKTVGESCEAVGSRYLKEQGLQILTKIPVTIVKTDNKIPEIESDF